MAGFWEKKKPTLRGLCPWLDQYQLIQFKKENRMTARQDNFEEQP